MYNSVLSGRGRVLFAYFVVRTRRTPPPPMTHSWHVCFPSSVRHGAHGIGRTAPGNLDPRRTHNPEEEYRRKIREILLCLFLLTRKGIRVPEIV